MKKYIYIRSSPCLFSHKGQTYQLYPRQRYELGELSGLLADLVAQGHLKPIAVENNKPTTKKR